MFCTRLPSQGSFTPGQPATLMLMYVAQFRKDAASRLKDAASRQLVIANWIQLLTAPIAYAAGVSAPRVLLQTINDSSILACGTTEASSASCCCDSDVQVNFYITAANDAEAQALTSAFTRASLGANNSFATCLQQVGVCSAADSNCQDTWPSKLHTLCTLAAAAPVCALPCKVWSKQPCVAIVKLKAHI